MLILIKLKMNSDGHPILNPEPSLHLLYINFKIMEYMDKLPDNCDYPELFDYHVKCLEYAKEEWMKYKNKLSSMDFVDLNLLEPLFNLGESDHQYFLNDKIKELREDPKTKYRPEHYILEKVFKEWNQNKNKILEKAKEDYFTSEE